MGLVFFCSILFAVLAVLAGMLWSGFIARNTPVMTWFELVNPDGRGPLLKGAFPSLHYRTQWGFTHEELAATDLTGQTIVVTGANAGLGYWTAHYLSAQNAHVVIVCRNKKKCKKAASDITASTGNVVTPMVCDMASFASIKSFTSKFKENFEKLDSLVLNAGMLSKNLELSEDGIEKGMAVNHFGPFYLTLELIPLLEKAASTSSDKVATVVVVSSSTHYMSSPQGIYSSLEEMNDPSNYDMDLNYAQSKLANILFAQELADRYKSSNVLVNAIHPGFVKTKMQVSAFDSTSNNALAIMSDVLQYISWEPEDAALTQLYCAVSKKVKKEKITGKYFHPIARETKPDPHASNKKLQTFLWNLSEQVVNDFINSSS